MSAWWWLAIAPAAYALTGYVVAWVVATHRIRQRPACSECGKQQHARECTCHDCRNRTHVCNLHLNDDSGLLVALWPIHLAFVAAEVIGHAWGHTSPAAIVERQAERKRMHVLVRADKEVEDA